MKPVISGDLQKEALGWKKMRLLVVEDEAKMAGLLRRGLEEEGYQVTTTLTGTAAVELARWGEFELIVLDVMLPGMDGFQVARSLRKGGNGTPILMLTARDATPDVVHGLDVGADDYLTKPFSFEVLLARIRALLRRGAVSPQSTLRIGDLELDWVAREVKRSGRLVSLTKTEFELLEYLMRRPGQVASREVLLTAVWGHDREVESNTLDAFIRLLRSKVEPEGSARLIHTVRGVGYVARAEEPE